LPEASTPSDRWQVSGHGVKSLPMRIFKIALPVLFAAGVSLFAARAFTDATEAAAEKLAQEHARSQFEQRAAIARAAPDAERYRADLKTLLRNWFADEADIGNRFPMLRGQLAPFMPAPPKGNLAEWQELAESQVSAWREGKIELLETAPSQGLRLDLLRVKSIGSHLAVDVAIWGAPEESQLEESEPGKQAMRLTVPIVFHGLSVRFFDANAKLVARIDGAGEPALRLDLPERLVADAPPGLVLGRYEVPLFPPNAAQVEWTLAAQVHSPSGEPRLAAATWKSSADPAWSGAAWSEADKVVAEGEAEARANAPESQQQNAKQAVSKGNARIAVWPERE
jgi:hypothetical protein